MWRTLLLAACLVQAGGALALELSPAEAAGRRIYLEGVGSANGEISARVGAADTLVPASLMPCANCHGADGRGRPEGGVRPPDITWRRLSTPYGQRQANGRSHGPYDEGALARAVSEGLDPAGNRLDPAMPRFVMSLRDMANLSAYLKRLEDDRDPGVEEGELRLGTLLPTRGPLADLGHTVEAVLRGALAQVNDAGGIHGRKLTLVVRDSGTNPREAERAHPNDRPAALLWDSIDNEVVDNVVRSSGIADIAVGSLGDTASLGNCFGGNEIASSAPAGLETLAPCEGSGSGDWADGALDLVALLAAERPPAGDYRTTPEPPAQPSMPDPESAPFAPFRGPRPVDVDAIAVPTGRPS